jgi:outer membrane protein OmpA-like peptidoglycan-associated protein
MQIITTMKTGGIFIIAVILSLSIQAQTSVTEERGTVRTTTSSLHKAGKELVVSISMDITRDLSSNESVVLVPVVSDSLEHRLELPPIYINSRKQHIIFLRETGRKDKAAQALQRKNGDKQTMHYLQSAPFEQWMNQATLTLVEKSCGCGIPGTEDFTCIARLHPQSTPVPQLAFLTPQVETSKIRTEKGSAFIDFPVNVTAIHKEFSNNAAELDKIIETLNTIKGDSNVNITHINIHGYASPDGPFRINERLARERTRALKEYVARLYTFDSTYIHTNYTPEDWEGFEALLGDTVFQDKEAIMKIVTSNIHPDRKEGLIKAKFPAFYRFILKHWFVILRHSDYTIEYYVRPFTVKESQKIFDTNPKNLSLEEMFRLALTHTPGSETYNRIFMTAVQLFPDNPTANLNAACIALMQKDTKAAAGFLEKAPLVPETALAKGVLYFLQTNYEEAEKLFRQAKDAGLPQADDNLKLILELK